MQALVEYARRIPVAPLILVVIVGRYMSSHRPKRPAELYAALLRLQVSAGYFQMSSRTALFQRWRSGHHIDETNCPDSRYSTVPVGPQLRARGTFPLGRVTLIHAPLSLFCLGTTPYADAPQRRLQVLFATLCREPSFAFLNHMARRPETTNVGKPG